MHSASRDNRWFEDPDEFKPDRWDKKHAGKVHPFSYLPFGFGPRGCYGNLVAHTVIGEDLESPHTSPPSPPPTPPKAPSSKIHFFFYLLTKSPNQSLLNKDTISQCCVWQLLP